MARSTRPACVKWCAAISGWLATMSQNFPSSAPAIWAGNCSPPLIGRIPHQGVLETVDGFRRFAPAEHELRLLQLGERMPQCALVASDQRSHQGIGELAPERGANLGDLPHRGEAVQPR